MNSAARNGSLIAATWLIGVGLVLLVREVTNLSWTEAWPLFVILGGVGALVSLAINGRPRFGGLWALTWPIVWVAIGVILRVRTGG